MNEREGNDIGNGFDSFCEIRGVAIGSDIADKYVYELNKTIEILNKDINHFAGYNTPSPQLKGDIAEFWHSDTHNIYAALNDSKFRTLVDRSHDFASADVTSNWDEKFGLKYLKNGQDSAKAQSWSYFERYCKYKAESGNSDISFIDFLKERGFENENILNDPIYNGQVRIIPSDQLKEAIEYLRFKIAKENLIRPDQVQRYQDTLDNLSSKITDPDGISSVELSADDAKTIAEIAKEGKFDAKNFGFATEDLVELEHVLKQGIKAGTSAAIITMVLKTAPVVYDMLQQLISQGKIDESKFKELGFAAISGGTEGFIRGFISASIVTGCESGLFGDALKTVSPNVVAGLTVIFYSTMKDSFYVAKGTMSKYELANNLSRNLFVTGCALGFGTLTQVMLPAIPGAYLLGNFVGSFVGSFAYIAWDHAFMSFCVETGFTMFGLVKQDYTLPDSVLKEIGIDIFEFDQYLIDEYKIDEFHIDEYEGDFITVLRRGVIGVHQVGYSLV